MFKAKRWDTGQAYTVLSVRAEPPHYYTYFLIWEDYKWRWIPAEKFIPPAVDIQEYLKNEIPF